MLLHDDTGDLYDNEPFWDVWLRAAGVEGVDSRRGPHFSHAVLAFEAAIDAVGVVASMPVLAAEDIAAGRLVVPFDLNVPLDFGVLPRVPRKRVDAAGGRAVQGLAAGRSGAGAAHGQL